MGGDTPHPPTHWEQAAPLDVMGVQRKGPLEALLGFGGFLKEEAECPVVQPALDVALVLSYPLDTRDRCWSEGCCSPTQHAQRTGEATLEQPRLSSGHPSPVQQQPNPCLSRARVSLNWDTLGFLEASFT